MMNVKEKLFFRAPPWLKNLMLSTYGWLERRKRYGSFYRQNYQKLSLLMKATPEVVLAFHSDRLRELLYEAIMYSPWYSAVFQQHGVTADSIANEPPLDILGRLPLLEKTMLKTRAEEVMSANPARQAVATVSTSGTSGSPMKVVFDAEGRQCTYAEWRRYHDWLGLPEKFRSVRFSGRIIVAPATIEPPFWAHNWPDCQLFMSSYHLKNDYLPLYIEKLNAFQPALIDGYPSAVYILARYLLRTKTQLFFQPTAISLTAETLMEHQRKTIEEAFGCKVYNQYASSEGAPWIVECSQGNYHLWLDTGVFEFINRQELDSETDIAELVVTSFRNFKTPLIRYRIGDYVQLYKWPIQCACGAPYPAIKGIIGRNDDILFTHEKGSVGRLDPAYKGVEGIQKSKIVQNSPEEVDVLLVPEDNFDDSQKALLIHNLKDRLGSKILINIKIIDDIPLGENGKLKSVERRFSLPET